MDRVLDDKIKQMAETFADTCFRRDSFRWQKVVQYYAKGITDWLASDKRLDEIEKRLDKLEGANAMTIPLI